MRTLPLAAVAVALATLCPSALADDVILKNGRVLRGQVVERNARVVVVDIGPGTVTLRASQVAEIRRDIAWRPEKSEARCSSPVIEELVSSWRPRPVAGRNDAAYRPRYQTLRTNPVSTGMAGRRRNNARPSRTRY